MPTNRSRTEEEEMLNHLLISIVIANGGVIKQRYKFIITKLVNSDRGITCQV